jgi:hypothetical protein
MTFADRTPVPVGGGKPAEHSLAAAAKPTDRRTNVVAREATIRASGAPSLVASLPPQSEAAVDS